MSNNVPPQKVAIISDTHGVVNPNIINIVKQCDQVIHAGDICGAHVLDLLEKISPKVTAVAGNNDAPGLWPEEQTDIVSALPEITRLALPGGEIAIEHGHKHGMHQPVHSSLRAAHPGARVIVYGHTHTMTIDEDDTPWIINPGAAGSTRTRGGPSCMVLTASATQDWKVDMHRFADSA